MKDIDYDAYLKTIPDLATSQKDIIKKYLEEQCEKDEVLKALYKPSHIDGCYNFILECVRKTATGGCNAVVEDAVVFKMARDYFIEILPKITEDAPEVKPAEVEKVQETVKEVTGQIEEDAAEEPAEEKLEIQSVEETPAEPEPKQQSDEVQYDEEGQGMLFSF